MLILHLPSSKVLLTLRYRSSTGTKIRCAARYWKYAEIHEIQGDKFKIDYCILILNRKIIVFFIRKAKYRPYYVNTMHTHFDADLLISSLQ